MKVMKWEIESDFNGNREELLENGWEPFATKGNLIMFRRPDGYVEIDKPEKVKVLKWEMTSKSEFESDKLLEEGWEPFACNGGLIRFRRPSGYIEVELKN